MTFYRHRPRDDGARAAPGRARRLHHPAQPDGRLRDRAGRGQSSAKAGTQRKGEPHAEVFALQAAGERARGATAYVTLEPCAHAGSTGPCADALIAAGVARVVAAMRDPFPQVDGAGFEKLQRGRHRGRIGLMEAQARALNRGFLSRIERGRPWLRIKLATSLDGRSALAVGESKWISGEAARVDVQHWRARAGAILTGAGTVLIDDPQLTVRLERRHAVRAAAARGARSGPGDGRARPRARRRRADAVPARARCASRRAASSADRAPCRCAKAASTWPRCSRLLAERGINEVQVEAGATLAGAFLAAGLVDEMLLYVAPVLLGERARPLFDGLHIDAMTQRLKMHDRRIAPHRRGRAAAAAAASR